MKNLMFAVCAVFAFVTVSAQEISFGAKAGLNFASVTGDDTDDLKSRTGFVGGAVAKIGITEKFVVQPELLYSAKGATADEDGIDITVKFDYLSLPILASYEIAPGLSLQAGPELGFLLNAEVVGEEDGNEVSIDLSDETSSFDFGVAVGAQYELDMGVFFQARYTFGLSNLNDFEGSDDFSNQNGAFQIGVGYFFL